jgi:hypothetical protein
MLTERAQQEGDRAFAMAPEAVGGETALIDGDSSLGDL